MQAKFAEISEIPRILAIKLRTFASEKKAAKFRGMRRNFVPVGRNFVFGETKYGMDKTNFRFHETKFCLPERNFVFQEFVADHSIAVTITSCKTTGTCTRSLFKRETSQRLVQLLKLHQPKPAVPNGFRHRSFAVLNSSVRFGT